MTAQSLPPQPPPVPPPVQPPLMAPPDIDSTPTSASQAGPAVITVVPFITRRRPGPWFGLLLSLMIPATLAAGTLAWLGDGWLNEFLAPTTAQNGGATPTVLASLDPPPQSVEIAPASWERAPLESSEQHSLEKIKTPLAAALDELNDGEPFLQDIPPADTAQTSPDEMPEAGALLADKTEQVVPLPPQVCQLASSDDRKFGTAIHWEESPDVAALVAEKQKKLVFLIQVSGNFARQEFT